MSDILIIGGGFAGLSAAIVAADEIRSAGREDRVTLVSDSDQITIRPRLYEKDPDSLRAPLRPSLDAAGVVLVLGSAEAVDTDARAVSLKDGTTLGYDRLILATGSELPPIAGPGRRRAYPQHRYLRRCQGAGRSFAIGCEIAVCPGSRYLCHCRWRHDRHRTGGGNAQPDRPARR
ncbi:MAG: FAD-dependent oxidoreductase [Alphaproteobacteria bacterium]